MFIQFDLASNQPCDNCGAAVTIMHVVFVHSGASFDLCRLCFDELTAAINKAAHTLAGQRTPLIERNG